MILFKKEITKINIIYTILGMKFSFNRKLPNKKYKYFPSVPTMTAPEILPFKEWMFIHKFRSFEKEHKYKIDFFIKNLTYGLDKKSTKMVKIVWNRYIKYLPETKSNNIKRDKLFSREEIKMQNKIIKEYKKYIEGYKLPDERNTYEIGVFYFEHGLKNLNKLEKNYIAGSDFMDCGAYIGDSILIMDKYNPKRIFAFEIDDDNYNLLQKTLKINSLSAKVIPYKKGISNKKQIFQSYGDKASTTFLKIDNKRYFKNKIIECDSIDNIVQENKINPKFLKFDIEGYELKGIMGASETIKKYKPIMMISIYHSPEDFLFIKPFIENLKLGYTFRIENHNPFDPVYETVLMAIPPINIINSKQ